MSTRAYLVLTTVLISVLFIAGNLIGYRIFSTARIDFTDNRIYTLSSATRTTLRGISEPVELTLVYNRDVGQNFPGISAYAARVRELVATYEKQSGGRVRVRTLDPKPFTPDEDEALAAGVTAIETGNGDPLYFGLIGRNAIDDERVIPFLAPERETTLEYDLTRLITRLDNPEPPRIGLITSIDGLARPTDEGGYALRADLAKSFTLELIADDFLTIPETADVLFIAHPPTLSRRQWYEIDQFLMRRGRALFLIDPAAKLASSTSPFGNTMTAARSDLGPFANSWGVSLASDAVADAANAWSIPIDRGDGRIDELAHPLFVSIPADAMNAEDIVTADLTRLVRFGAPGALMPGKIPAGLLFTPLIETGPSPSFINARSAMLDLPPGEVLRAYRSERHPFILAARLSGRLPSAFPDGAPAYPRVRNPSRQAEIDAAEASAPAPLSQSALPADIIMIADTDFTADEFYLVAGQDVAAADNGALVVNALDTLSGAGELSRLRSRAPSHRPMTRIAAMRAAAEKQYFQQQADLEARLEKAQARLAELQAGAARDGSFTGDLESVLDADQRAELAGLRSDIVGLRGRLRDIERDYRRGIDNIEAWLKAINIWGGPMLVALAGIIVWRRRIGRGGGRS